MSLASPDRLSDCVVLMVVALLSATCGPQSEDEIPPDAAERYADAMCGAHDRCGCIGPSFDTASECRDAAIDQFDYVADWPGLRFRKQCFADFLKYLEEDDCDPVGPTWKPIPCLVFEGTIKHGDACTPVSALPTIEHGGGGGLVDDTCADGGVCAGGRCQAAPQPAVGLGESCVLEAGTRCDDSQEKLYCASDGVCRQEVAVGGVCDTPYACADVEMYCAGLTEVGGTGVCTQRVSPGEACNPDEIIACEFSPEVFCEADGTCGGSWPGVCGLLTASPGFFTQRDWIPLR